MPADAPPAPTPAAPDWNAISDDIHCPLCEYNLRGLSAPRCPECGFAFRWPDLLDSEKRVHPYLFEHHPERSLQSFFQTLVGGWRPFNFWTHLRPSQPSRPRRLLVYATLTVLLLPLTRLLESAVHEAADYLRRRQDAHEIRTAIAESIENEIRNSGQRSNVTLYGYASVEAYLDALHPYPPVSNALRRTSEHILDQAVYVPLAWPVLIFAALQIFQMSMQKARIRAIHVLRCVVYSYDIFFWIALLTFVNIWLALIFGISIDNVVTLALSLCIGLFCPYRLATAYRRYLKFSHPTATVISAQIIALLVILVCDPKFVDEISKLF